MPQKQNQTAGPKRSFDINPPSPTAKTDFPGVGMTLNAYSTTKVKPRRSVSLPTTKSARRNIYKRLAIVAAVILVGIVGWLGIKFVYNAHKLFGGNVLDVLSTTKLQGETNGRVNILLAGNSADDPGHQGGNLTDSIMIMSIDTKNHSAFMMSIPRDLYVSVPGNGHQKINAVYPAGENANFNESGFAKGGMGLLQKTIADDIGINCPYYALINYNAFRDAVNAVGGVDFTVASSDPRGLYDPDRDYAAHTVLVKLSNGTHHLTGEQALDLARARGDARGSYGFPNSDFDRTQHQRQLILALRSKATSAGVLTNPVKLSSLFDSVGSNVKTNFKLGDVRRLYDLTKGIGGSNIQSVGLNSADGQNLLANYRTPRNESALIPAAGVDDFSDIQSYIQRLTSNDLVVRENAEVVVLNGTTKTGLAGQEKTTLTEKNIRVSVVADADNDGYTQTKIIDLSAGKKPHSRDVLQKIYTNSSVETSSPLSKKYPTANFIIILGSDRLKTTGN